MVFEKKTSSVIPYYAVGNAGLQLNDIFYVLFQDEALQYAIRKENLEKSRVEDVVKDIFSQADTVC